MSIDAMLPTFLAQLAGGACLVVSLLRVAPISFKYLRLMAYVALALTVFGGALLFARSAPPSGGPTLIVSVFALGAVVCLVWLVINGVQGEPARETQRIPPLLAGVILVAASTALVMQAEVVTVQPGAVSAAVGGFAGLARIGAPMVTTLLGSLLLGGVTAGMLLGHRYLTDTGMSIVPLRRLAKLYLAVVGLRLVWVGVVSLPVWSDGFRPHETAMWFWLMYSVRVGVGLLGTAVFAWMMWDCVRHRATQSATAMFYLSMVFVFVGELSGQYLLRTEALAI